MRCETCQELLVDYHYGELERGPRAEVAEHLGACGACAVEYCRLHADLAGLGQSLGAGPRPEVGQALRARVERTFRPSWWRRLVRLGAAPIPAYQGALILVGLLLVWLLVVAPRLGPERRSGPHTTVLSGYDASRVVPLDRHSL